MVNFAKTLVVILTFHNLTIFFSYIYIAPRMGIDVIYILYSIHCISAIFLTVTAIFYFLRKKIGWWLITLVFPLAMLSGVINIIDIINRGSLLSSDYKALIIFFVTTTLFVINLLPPVRKHFRILQK